MNVTNHITQLDRPLVAIVDDDESVREAMASLMRCIGCRAESFDSAEEFLLAGRLPETDCLILDLKMPGMGGMALRRMLAAIKPPLPTIFITAHWDEATRPNGAFCSPPSPIPMAIGIMPMITAARRMNGKLPNRRVICRRATGGNYSVTRN